MVEKRFPTVRTDTKRKEGKKIIKGGLIWRLLQFLACSLLGQNICREAFRTEGSRWLEVQGFSPSRGRGLRHNHSQAEVNPVQLTS